LLLLRYKNGNGLCADCDKPNPECASAQIGIFICSDCADAHLSLAGPNYTPLIRSILLDAWTEEEVQRTEEMGNQKWNVEYEKYVPYGKK
jgi:ribosomal protein L37AE/L43A